MGIPVLFDHRGRVLINSGDAELEGTHDASGRLLVSDVARSTEGDGGGGLTPAQAARLLPTLPATGSRDDRIPKFNGNTLGWEKDDPGPATPAASETVAGIVRGATDAQSKAASGTTILGWTVNRLRALIGAALPTISTADAQAGTSQARRAWNALRVRQAIDARVPAWARQTSPPTSSTAKPPHVHPVAVKGPQWATGAIAAGTPLTTSAVAVAAFTLSAAATTAGVSTSGQFLMFPAIAPDGVFGFIIETAQESNDTLQARIFMEYAAANRFVIMRAYGSMHRLRVYLRTESDGSPSIYVRGSNENIATGYKLTVFPAQVIGTGPADYS